MVVEVVVRPEPPERVRPEVLIKELIVQSLVPARAK